MNECRYYASTFPNDQPNVLVQVLADGAATYISLKSTEPKLIPFVQAAIEQALA